MAKRPYIITGVNRLTERREQITPLLAREQVKKLYGEMRKKRRTAYLRLRIENYQTQIQFDYER